MRSLALAGAIVLVASPAMVRADCPVMAGADAALAAHGDEARLAWIEGRLARTAHRGMIWVRGWEIGIVAATAVDLALIPILGNTRSHQIDFGLGAATTIIGIVPMLFWQPAVIEDHAALAAAIAKPGADRCALLADAEHRLVTDAAAQHQQRAWYMHVGNVLLNAGVTLLFGAFHHWTSGVLNGVGGALVGEAIIFTEPVDQIDDLAHYRRGELDGAARAATAWDVAPDGVGLAFTLHF